MMVEATPGKWFVAAIERPDGRVDYRVQSVTEEHGDIWSVASVTGVGEKGGETEANAYLIAHAPALRDSLEEMLNAALEMEPPSEEVRTRAMQVFLAAKGL